MAIVSFVVISNSGEISAVMIIEPKIVAKGISMIFILYFLIGTYQLLMSPPIPIPTKNIMIGNM